MSLLDFFDHRTLLASACVFSIIFSLVFAGMSVLYPRVRGVRAIAIAFAFNAPQVLLVALRGHIPDLWSIVIANLFGMSSQIAIYEAVVRFTRGRRHSTPLWVTTYVTLAILYFYCEVHHNVVPRIVALGIATIVFQAFTAIALLKGAQRSNQRTLLRIFAAILILVGCASVRRVVMTWRYGAPNDVFARDSIQTPALVAAMVFGAITGVIFVILFTHEMLLRTRHEAHQDPLSLTFNRRGLEVMLQAEIETAAVSHKPLSIALVDIDHFKHINDLGGHAAGDEAIRRVAAMISHRLRGKDHLGRFGGDEFLLILPHTAEAEAMQVVERIAVDVAREGARHLGLPLDGLVTLSAGITEALPGERAVGLIARADLALYKAKSDGRNCCRSILGPVPDAAREFTAVA